MDFKTVKMMMIAVVAAGVFGGIASIGISGLIEYYTKTWTKTTCTTVSKQGPFKRDAWVCDYEARTNITGDTVWEVTTYESSLRYDFTGKCPSTIEPCFAVSVGGVVTKVSDVGEPLPMMGWIMLGIGGSGLVCLAACVFQALKKNSGDQGGSESESLNE
eukprot:CAMPEP_0179217002 /NCGR_PEP_ID=MMETSP0797-20121207/3684_1 /TAXON_ID=47934 /ORGANISM="Dinophysis acuminata, Strain DAEP01" /LENGTH=159 /DNA_ID=CAMNT_0020923207 /DNA_START=85 /DNA_END=564 /DNA_ORIENTATION=+